MSRIVLALLLAIAPGLLFANTYAFSMAELDNYIERSKSSGDMLSLLIGEKIEERLNEANISLNEGELLFDASLPNIKKSGCSRYYKLSNLHASVRLDSASRFQFVLDRLSAPIIGSADLSGDLGAEYDANPYYGHYVARVETTYNWAKQLNALLKSMSNDLKMHGISNEAFETIRKRKILELESKTWANKEVAKLYKNHRHEIKSGAMKNLYQYYQNLSYSDFQRTVKKYMSEAPVYYTRRPPTLLQMGKDVIIAFGSIFVLGLPFLRFIKKHRQKRMQECGH